MTWDARQWSLFLLSVVLRQKNKPHSLSCKPRVWPHLREVPMVRNICLWIVTLENSTALRYKMFLQNLTQIIRMSLSKRSKPFMCQAFRFECFKLKSAETFWVQRSAAGVMINVGLLLTSLCLSAQVSRCSLASEPVRLQCEGVKVRSVRQAINHISESLIRLTNTSSVWRPMQFHPLWILS